MCDRSRSGAARRRPGRTARADPFVRGFANSPWTGSRVGATLNDKMRILWATHGSHGGLAHSFLHQGIFSFRNSPPYRNTFWALKHWLLPAASVVILCWAAVGISSHLLFNVMDSWGRFCTPKKIETSLDTKGQLSKPITFDTRSFCTSTATMVEAGKDYTVIIEIMDPWKDGNIAINKLAKVVEVKHDGKLGSEAKRGDTIPPAGYGISDVADWCRKVFLISVTPFRRVIFRPWFHLLARIGPTGNDEYFLDAVKRKQPNTYEGKFRSRQSGELFIYVNDVAFPLRRVSEWLYGSHEGTARITVRQEN